LNYWKANEKNPSCLGERSIKMILSSKRDHYLAKFGIFLVTVALIAGMAGCGQPAPNSSLTIASTSGGNVTTPGEGRFSYVRGTVVDLVAEPDAGCRFVSWTGQVDDIADVNDATTSITMNGYRSITANFGLEVQNWYDLDAIRENLEGHHHLMNDLDSTTAGYEELASPTANGGKGWQPIGTGDDPFIGTFDGQGYEIHDLFINRPDEWVVGLFGKGGDIVMIDTPAGQPDERVIIEGNIKDIGLVNATVTGDVGIGGLVGWNEASTVSNSHFIGNVTGVCDVGGLVGYNQDGTVSGSYSTGNVAGGGDVGGLVGWNSYGFGAVNGGIVTNSYSTSNVTGGSAVGGLVGLNEQGTVNNSYSTGNVTGDEGVGGLVGLNARGAVRNSYSIGSVTGSNYVGGLVGNTDEGIVNNSFWDTEASGQATSAGGTGKTTEEMQDITTFSEAGWDIIAVANPGSRNPSFTWNIVDDETYPFIGNRKKDQLYFSS
jgi:hypothetical protein